AKRAEARQWHIDGVPFLEMLDRLGLSHTVTPELRAAIEGLTPDEVAIIRAVFLEEIDRAGTGSATMPVDCTLDQVPRSVTVTAESDKSGRQVAKVTAASK
ncbi:MAG: hypothetical protein ACXV9P_15935, partial [Acidimicrobiia bacterium]